jgi:Fur family ferric uptake transcriptional regulator
MQEFTHRMTPQRKVIIEELRKVKSHPTADEVYELVRKKLPRISLGTVYRNLELLSSEGLINKIEFGGGLRRYDGDLDHHIHIRCNNCGRIADISEEHELSISPSLSSGGDLTGSSGGFRITGYIVEYRGVCPDCDNSSASDEVPDVN